MFRIVQITTLTLIVSCFGAPASLAEPLKHVQAARISYAELDLSKPAGVEVLMRRIDRAADRVCNYRPSLSQIAANVRYEVCRAETTERAIASIDSPMLTALLHARRPDIKLAHLR